MRNPFRRRVRTVVVHTEVEHGLWCDDCYLPAATRILVKTETGGLLGEMIFCECEADDE